MEALSWLGIVACLIQSGLFSGLNLALLGPGRLRLEVEAEAGNPDAARVLALRQDANFLLCTVLWGNVSVNVLLTLLSDSVMAGATAFFVSTFAITFFGEILPQAFFSRNALRMGARFSPFIRFYQLILYPVARPSGRALDAWLGPEGVSWFREADLQRLLEKHMVDDSTDLARGEALSAMNVLDLDDRTVATEGEPVDPDSLIPVEVQDGRVVFPAFELNASDPFVAAIARSGHKWVVLLGPGDRPQLLLDADAFLRQVLGGEPFNPRQHCHRPIVVTDDALPLGAIIRHLEVEPEYPGDDVIDRDVILVWATERRVITGADLLGRIFRGVVTRREG